MHVVGRVAAPEHHDQERDHELRQDLWQAPAPEGWPCTYFGPRVHYVLLASFRSVSDYPTVALPQRVPAHREQEGLQASPAHEASRHGSDDWEFNVRACGRPRHSRRAWHHQP